MRWAILVAALLGGGPSPLALSPSQRAGERERSAATPITPLPAGRWEEHTVTGRCGGSAEGSARVEVYLPKGYAPARRWPLALALHGWNHEAARWRSLGLPALADRHGLVVVAPEMGTSVYERAFRPETLQPWGPAPGACWVAEVVLPWARGALAVDAARGRTGILGYSTGGRGALVVAARWPEVTFAGSLSGTYDLAALHGSTGEYRIHERVFGPRAAFPERWRAEEIPLDAPALAGARLWLAHGVEDEVVPVAQQDVAGAALRRSHPGLVARRVAGAGHDDTFWRAQLPPLVEALATAVGARPGGRPAEP